MFVPVTLKLVTETIFSQLWILPFNCDHCDLQSNSYSWETSAYKYPHYKYPQWCSTYLCQSCCCAILINLFHKCDFSWTRFFMYVWFLDKWLFCGTGWSTYNQTPCITPVSPEFENKIWSNKCLRLFSDDDHLKSPGDKLCYKLLWNLLYSPR